MKQVWIERNRTEAGKPFGVVWFDARGKQVRYFDELCDAREFAGKKMGKRGFVVEAADLSQ